MLAAGLQVLVDSGVLDQAAGTELPTGADEVLVTDIYKAMARARHSDAAAQVTLPSVIEPGAELGVKNDRPSHTRRCRSARKAQGARSALMGPMVRHHDLPIDP